MKISEKCPEINPIMQGAWAACLSYTITRNDALARFQEDTGLKFCPAKNGLEAAIDKATGFEEEFVAKFIDWFNENIWGGRSDGE